MSEYRVEGSESTFDDVQAVRSPHAEVGSGLITHYCLVYAVHTACKVSNLASKLAAVQVWIVRLTRHMFERLRSVSNFYLRLISRVTAPESSPGSWGIKGVAPAEPAALRFRQRSPSRWVTVGWIQRANVSNHLCTFHVKIKLLVTAPQTNLILHLLLVTLCRFPIMLHLFILWTSYVHLSGIIHHFLLVLSG